MDTRTPRTPTGDRSSGLDDVPALSMVKVPSDPAQVIVNHASFRVELGAASRPQPRHAARDMSSGGDTARIPVAGTAAGTRRRAPVVWSGRSAPDDTGATRLLQAARNTSLQYGAETPAGEGGATQVIPRVDGAGPPGFDVDATVETPTFPGPETRLLPQQMRSAGSAYEEVDESPYGRGEFEGGSYDDEYGHDGYRADGYRDDEYRTDEYRDEGDGARKRHGATPVRHGYYPGRRMNLGVVLLPLRVFLGFISIYAGMGKLCDPVYFDGGKRGSMVKWLNSLHPWELAEPLREFALQHPVGAGLFIAFFQVIVGVLTVLGLWQRVAAVVGALLSAALLLTVSWKSVPAYDAPDIIYLAAWSPLIIAGAPVYSIDGRLAGEAWRTLGPRTEIWQLRRRVLRRGALVTAIVVGLTLLVGSLLGGAVRDSDRVVVPGPGEAPRNELPGSPLPEEPGARRDKQSPSASDSPTQGATSASPSGAASSPGAPARETAGAGAGQPSQTQGAGQAPPQQSAPPQAPSTTAGPSSSGGTTGGTGTDGGSGSGGGSGGGSGAGGGSGGSGGGSGGNSRLVGGLLG
ncbi:DoxX family protein [Streptomyces aurantiacus]|uniref:DoxX family protein n=1 Tax=Streptomyces aurantiacus TaxID=47760 RepID=UPI0027D8535F|nr:DoxX family protein [Streptomyces aurantiacus]